MALGAGVDTSGSGETVREAAGSVGTDVAVGLGSPVGSGSAGTAGTGAGAGTTASSDDDSVSGATYR